MKPDHPNPNHNVRVMSLSELEDFNKANVSDYDSKKDAFVKGQIEKVNSGP